jgi:hypothetical protein
MIKSQRTLQEYYTSLAPGDVLEQARDFFQRRLGIYAAFLEREGPTHLTFRGQGTEEIAIAVQATDVGTRVTASTYLFDMQVSRFFTTLPASETAPAVLAEGSAEIQAAEAAVEKGTA